MPCACLASLSNLLGMVVGVPSLVPGVSLSHAASLGLAASAALDLSGSGGTDFSAAQALDASFAPSVDAGAMSNLALTANMSLMANLALGIDLSCPEAGFAIEELGASIPALVSMLAQLPLFAIPNLAACAQMAMAASVGLDLSASVDMSMALSAALSANLSASLSASFSAMLSAQLACMPGLGLDLSFAPSIDLLAGAIPAINANLALLESVLSMMSMPLLLLVIAFFTPLELLISTFGFGVLAPGFDFAAALSATAAASASMSMGASAGASMSMGASASASAGISGGAAASMAATAAVCASADFAAALSGLIIVPPLVALFLPLLMLILSCLGLGMVQTTPCSMCFLKVPDRDMLCPGLEALSKSKNKYSANASALTREKFFASIQSTQFGSNMAEKIEIEKARIATEKAEKRLRAHYLNELKTWLEASERSETATKVAIAEVADRLGMEVSDLVASDEFDKVEGHTGMSDEEILGSTAPPNLENLPEEDVNDLSELPESLKQSMSSKGVSFPAVSADEGSEAESGENEIVDGEGEESGKSKVSDAGIDGAGVGAFSFKIGKGGKTKSKDLDSDQGDDSAEDSNFDNAPAGVASDGGDNIELDINNPGGTNSEEDKQDSRSEFTSNSDGDELDKNVDGLPWHKVGRRPKRKTSKKDLLDILEDAADETSQA